MSSFVVFMKTPVARSISTGSSGVSTTSKDQNMDMNGPLVPEKVLKSIQVCGIYVAKDFMLQFVCSVIGHRQQNVARMKQWHRRQ